MKNKIVMFGNTSSVSKEIKFLVKDKFECIAYGRRDFDIEIDANNVDTNYIDSVLDYESEIYFFSLGLLIPKNILDQSHIEITNSLNVNLIFIIKACELILSKNKIARIFILGSESGKKGSFDTTYFLSKAALSKYVKEKKIKHPDQQILLISPSTISDANMTLNRSDQERVEMIARNHPKNRLILSKDIAKFIVSLFDSRFDYISNTEIEYNGGKFARM